MTYKLHKYRVIDNNNPSRNVLVTAKNKSNALDSGAHELKTFNVRAIKLKDK